MNALILGASGGLGRSLAFRLAQRGVNLILVSQDYRDLIATASHLKLKYDIKAECIACDVNSTQEWTTLIKDQIALVGGVKYLIFPIGLSLDHDNGSLSDQEIDLIMNVNLLSVIKLTSVLLPEMMKNKSGSIIGFGSIAESRGRGSNILYSASKRALTSYFESIRHLTSSMNIQISWYQLGYIKTQQTFGKRLLFPITDCDIIAERVVRNLNQSGGEYYFPKFWYLITIIVRFIPWVVFKKLTF